jgi:deoxycytidine triphosphate deaminase
MSVLAAKEIRRRLALDIDDYESMVITPPPTCFDHDSVDLRLGCYFRLPAISSTACIRPCRANPQFIIDHYSELVHRPYGRERYDPDDPRIDSSSLILQPQHSVLAGTLEYIKMAGDVSGQILTKSSWARIFITIESAPWIHPFYRGCLTLEISNLGNVPIALPVGEPIAQLVLETLGPSDAQRRDLIDGQYAGAVMPEAPRFKGYRDKG